MIGRSALNLEVSSARGVRPDAYEAKFVTTDIPREFR